MAKHNQELPFEQRLAGLDDAVTRAVHVAAMLRIASRPNPEASPPAFEGLRRKLRGDEEGGDMVSMRPADLKAPVRTPPEVTHWLRGLRNFHEALSRASEAEVPDRQMLLAQLERQVDELTIEADSAIEYPLGVVTDFANRATGKARLSPDFLESLETQIRWKLDQATADVVPERSTQGVFTGLVANRILNDVVDETLVRTGDAFVSIEPGRLPHDGPDGPIAIETPEPAGGVPALEPAPGGLTPAELNDLDVPQLPGALKPFDPSLIEAPPGDQPSEPGAQVASDDVQRLLDEAIVTDTPVELEIAEDELEPGSDPGAEAGRQGLEEPGRGELEP